MSFTLIAKRMDFETGGEHVVLLNEDTAIEHGINAGDHIVISIENEPEIVCVVDTTTDLIDKKHIGIYKEVYEKDGIKNDDQVLITLSQKPESVSHIRDKILGYELNYEDIKGIMDDIVKERLGVIEKTYFLSTIYNPGYSDTELYYLTKAMAETGFELRFDGIVADKHSIGGIAGKGITPLVVSIVSSFGLKVPNTSTRSITTPAGTADILETITPVSFNKDQLQKIIDEANACMIWGGGLGIAPADDELIRIERPIEIESFDKFLMSIIAKKVALGVNHLLVDIPAGIQGKIHEMKDVERLKDKFISLGAKFGIKVEVYVRHPLGIDGNGVGPKLEMREVLYVLENSPLKSMQLENEAVKMASLVLELTGVASTEDSFNKAKDALYNGAAYNKFKQIIKAQGGNENVKSSDLDLKSHCLNFKSVLNGTVKSVYNKRAIELGRILGCPLDKDAGIYFHKKPGDTINTQEKMFSIYSSTKDRLNLGIGYIQKNNLFEIV